MLDTVEIEPTAPHRATVVWLHGLGASGHDFEPIVPYLRLPSVRFVFPHAPARPVTINAGYVMPSWYDIRSLDFLAGDREDRAQLDASAAEVDALLAREAERTEQLVLIGFSQGGATALHVGARSARHLAGVAVLSGYLVGADVPTGDAATRFLFQHGRFDDVVPLFAGKQAYERVIAAGRPAAWREYALGHEVGPTEIADLAVFIAEAAGLGVR
jgi:phospholipase/carboxylesterase